MSREDLETPGATNPGTAVATMGDSQKTDFMNPTSKTTQQKDEFGKLIRQIGTVETNKQNTHNKQESVTS